MTKVSVIITTYGMPVFLNKAIESVFNQTLIDLEIIIVDDNDPHTEARILTEKIVQKHIKSSKKIIYLKHKKNKNGAAARNTGIAAAKGKYISFLDNDDEYAPQRMEKCYTVMQQSTEEYAGVYTGCEFKRNGKTYHIHKKVKEGNFMLETLAGTFMFSTGSNIFIRKNVVEELNGFDESFLRHQDYEFLVRLFEKYNLKAIAEVLLVKNNENFNLPVVKKMIQIKDKYLSKFDSVIKKMSLENQNFIFESHYISIAEQALKINNKTISKEYYKKANYYRKADLKTKLRKFAFRLLNLVKL
jgi:glycosyltransferase involved in cell wall biosynthesis